MSMEMLHNPVFWVTVSFVVFLALSGKKIATLLTRALDDRSAKIKHELDEAKKLRVEAENLLADYRKKQAEYLQEAEHMLAKAREDAAEFSHRAEADLKVSLDNRMQQAVDKIAREEAKAIEEVRNHVVDISLAAARTLIVEHIGSLSADDLASMVIGDIERKIH